MQPNHLPKHVLIIPDGNRRWARGGRLFLSGGHIKGAERFREVHKAAVEMGIPYFTFWAASEDNLRRRSHLEVQILTSLLKQELEKKSTLEDCLKNKIRLRVVGSWYNILHDHDLLHSIQLIQNRTRDLKQHFLTILFGYSGAHEMVAAVKKICQQHPRHIDEDVIRKALWTHDLPLVDLVIRTGACEEGLCWSHNSSGCMMYLTVNAKTFSPPTLWPDFTAEMFRQAIENYSKVPRRLGA